MRPILLSAFLVVLFLTSVVASTSLTVNNAGSIAGGPVGRWFDYAVVIMMENHSINYTYHNSGSVNSCLGNCTYFTALANANGLAEGYTLDHVNGSSIGDYVAITSGYGNMPSACNGGPFAKGCSLLKIQNIVDSLENVHLSWEAYMEGYPISAGCDNTSTGGPNYYDPGHNPFIYYSDIQKNATRCSHIVSANSLNPQPQSATLPRCWPIALDNDDLFINDLNSMVSASNYMFLTPDSVDDNHDCNDVSVGNAWLQQIVPQILNSVLFKTRRAALFITFDEPFCTFRGCPSAAPELFTVWTSNPANPTTKAAFKSIQAYTHFSALRTIEDNWGLPPLVASNDGGAKNMQEFFL